MKVVLFGNYAIYFIPRLSLLAERLNKEGGELWILEARNKNILYSNLPQIEKNNLNVVHIWDAPAELNYREKAFYMLDKVNPDVLVTGFVSFPFGAAGLAWAKSRKKGIIEYDDQREDTFVRSKLNNWVKKRLLRNVDAFLCPAPAWDNTLLKWGFKKEEIFYGLDTSDNDFWGKKVIDDLSDNLPESYFMTVGRQVKMKNLTFFLQSYLKYISKGGVIPLVMVGEGPEHDKLVELAHDNPMVTFLGFQTRDSLRSLFVRMKALVLPSFRQETWGMVVNECMASGNIVAISNEAGASTTLVIDGKNGFHFSPYSEEDIIKVLFKIESLTSEEDIKMRDNSKHIINNWGIDKFVNELYDACVYSMKNKKKVSNMIDKLLIRIWNGRYNFTEAT